MLRTTTETPVGRHLDTRSVETTVFPNVTKDLRKGRTYKTPSSVTDLKEIHDVKRRLPRERISWMEGRNNSIDFYLPYLRLTGQDRETYRHVSVYPDYIASLEEASTESGVALVLSQNFPVTSVSLVLNLKSRR